MKMSDDEQTAIRQQAREMLQSIAIQAVQAQEHIGAEKCSDLLYDIELDLQKANLLQSKLIKGE